MKTKISRGDQLKGTFDFPGRQISCGTGNYPHTPACRSNNLLPIILPENTRVHPAVRSLVKKIKRALSN
jgi:hypothetical protein